LIWDMDEDSGAMKGPWRYSGQWAPSSWRTSFKSLILGVICRCYVMPNCSHPSWHGRDYFSTWKVLRWMIIMNFEEIMLLRLRSGGNIGLHPMYLLLTVVLLVVVLLHRLLLVRAHRLFPHLHLTLSRSSFLGLRRITKGWRRRSWRIFRSLSRRIVRVFTRHILVCDGWL
jgi:hypothetical protein